MRVAAGVYWSFGGENSGVYVGNTVWSDVGVFLNVIGVRTPANKWLFAHSEHLVYFGSAHSCIVMVRNV